MSEEKKRIAIIGLPNTGKSQVFNNLTGEYTLVSNYPLTTVEIKRTDCAIRNVPYEIIDTPGLHSLYIHSEEELVVRDMLFSAKPDAIIQCIDANRLKQSLVLTLDLLELEIPMVISLNFTDEIKVKGISIDTAELSRLLGVEVISSVAVDNIGTEELKDALLKASKGNIDLIYGDVIEEGIFNIASKLPRGLDYKRKLSILLLLNDPFLVDYLKKRYGESLIEDLRQEINNTRRQFKGNISRFIDKKYNRWIEEITARTIKRGKAPLAGFSETFARLSRHPVFGVPILGFFLVTTYFLVVHVSGLLEGYLSAFLVDPIIGYISGIVRSGFWHDFFIGYYGILTLGLFNAVVTVLPILFVFFLIFGLLEDIGYIPNLCVLTKRVFEKIGLTGNAIMPIVLGFGCKTMATLVTRGIRSRKEKFIAVYLIAFAIPCSAQLAIDMGVLGRVGFVAFLIAYGTLFFVEIAAGVILNKVIKEEEKSAFLQELPAIRMPNPKAIFIKTYYRLYWFLKKAVPIFIISAIALFISDKTGLLTFSKKLMSPVVVNWLGLPLDIVDVLILSLARHEAAAGLLLRMVGAGALNYIQAIVAVVITTMFVPCFANIVAICKEMGAKTGIAMVLTINISSFILAGILNQILLFTIGR